MSDRLTRMPTRYSFIMFVTGGVAHGSTVYSNSIFFPQAKGKNVRCGAAYLLDGTGENITDRITLNNVDGNIYLTSSISYLSKTIRVDDLEFY